MSNSNQHRLSSILLPLFYALAVAAPAGPAPPPAIVEDVIGFHKVVLDAQGKLLPATGPAEVAYDRFLRLRWQFIKRGICLTQVAATDCGFGFGLSSG